MSEKGGGKPYLDVKAEQRVVALDRAIALGARMFEFKDKPLSEQAAVCIEAAQKFEEYLNFEFGGVASDYVIHRHNHGPDGEPRFAGHGDEEQPEDVSR